MSSFDFMIIVGPLVIVLANVIVYLAMGKLGKRSRGSGNKYSPFTGGEEAIPSRGIYQSELFVFATLFLVVEVFALLLSGSFSAPTSYYPLLFLTGGGAAMVIVILWFLRVGGGTI
jgi:NADH:ubiquinone oxidoreductase subunit 3 (subunit A)